MSKQHLAIKKKNIAITEKGVVIEGDAAGQLATLLIRHREQLLTAARQVDDEIKLNDIYVDEAGRVVLRSRKMQQYAYEAIRLGASPASAKGLGRLVKRTGGKIGTARLKSKILADPDSVRQTLRPTLQGPRSKLYLWWRKHTERSE